MLSLQKGENECTQKTLSHTLTLAQSNFQLKKSRSSNFHWKSTTLKILGKTVKNQQKKKMIPHARLNFCLL